ncbi:MAG: protein kinase [Lachnospiraceae bacterium]|nr:protein kinase [Lachnospiraceae bacterium]
MSDKFLSEYDESYEKMLPEELLDRYHIMECLNSVDGCDTLLVRRKDTGKKVVAKCYAKDSTLYNVTEPKQLSSIENDAIPHFEGEYSNEEVRCVLREYIEGSSLYEYVKGHKLTEEEIADIAIKLAEAMQALHQMEPPVIHRDIKPQNIIIREDGSLVLIDLGISRIYKEKENDEDTFFGGTHFFAAPEQYGFMQTDVRSDIYSYGVVLSWMLTGNARPIKAPSSKLEKIAAKCCEFSPDKRYKNDTILKAQLHKAVSESGKEQKKNHRTMRIAVALLLAVVLAGGIGYMVSGNFDAKSRRVKLKDPMIEQAVRVMLDKPSGKITVSDLESVTELYISDTRIAKTMEECYEYFNDWDGEYGDISDLSDLEKMPNLSKVCIIANRIEDLSALQNLTELQDAEFSRNSIKDISGLANKSKLDHVGLGDNEIISIEALATCRELRSVNLRAAGSFDGKPIESIDGTNLLDIACDSDAYQYLDDKYILTLKLGAPGQKDLECIRNMYYVKELYIYYSEITDISAVTGREDITYLNMTACKVDDVSPVFTLPNLEKLVISNRNIVDFEKYVGQNQIEYTFEVEFTD